MVRPSVLASLALFVISCTGSPPTASAPPGEPTQSATPTAQEPSPTAVDPVSALAGEFEAAGLDARPGDEFYAAPLSNSGRHICVDGEQVNVYLYPSADDAAGAAQTINPQDPSQVGSAIIEWVGNPRFWLHDRAIVLYLGVDADLTGALVEVLGEPFAAGRGRPPLRGDEGC